MDNQPRQDPRARFPIEEEIFALAFELFFRDRQSARAFAWYWRRAEDELLERAAAHILRQIARGGTLPRLR